MAVTALPGKPVPARRSRSARKTDGGIAEMSDQLFRVYGTDTTGVGEGELIKGLIFHGAV